MQRTSAALLRSGDGFIRNTYHRCLPFCHFSLRIGSERLTEVALAKRGLVASPTRLGEHLRNRRLILGLRQEDVAARLRTMREVYDRWERNEREPVISEWPGILSFLDCYPFREKTTADLVLRARRCQGVDQKTLAKAIGTIHQRLRRWEHGKESVPEEAEQLLRQLTRLYC